MSDKDTVLKIHRPTLVVCRMLTMTLTVLFLASNNNILFIKVRTYRIGPTIVYRHVGGLHN